MLCLDCGRNGGALRHYLAELFRKAGLPDSARQFELARIGNPDKIAIIESVGVKRIDLKVDIAAATAEVLIEGEPAHGVWPRFIRGVGDMVRDLTARDEELAQLRQSEKGSVTVSINVGRGDLQAAKSGFGPSCWRYCRRGRRGRFRNSLARWEDNNNSHRGFGEKIG